MIIIIIHIQGDAMTLSVSAWLQHKIDEYQFSVRDITVDFYMA